MKDLNVSIHTVLATALWFLGGTLIVIEVFGGPDGLGNLGIYLAGMGGVLNVRRFACQAGGLRERRAFEMGREVGEEMRAVHVLRSNR